MAIKLTENFRMAEGGRAWRMFEIVHDSGATKSVSAASLDLSYIEAIVGVNTRMSMVAVASNVLDQIGVTIGANNASLDWASTGVCTQYITIVGW
jgi:hypothetical protein